MSNSPLILIIQENSADGENVQRAISNPDASWRLQQVRRVDTALARIAGGGVSLIILNFSGSTTPGSEQLELLRKLRITAPEKPILVVQDREEKGPLSKTAKDVGAELLSRASLDTELSRMVRSALDRTTTLEQSRLATERRKPGTIVSFLGVNGGVGTTTIALNVACALAQWNRVVLAELRPTPGTLWQYFHPHHRGSNIAELLKSETIELAQVESCLWAYKGLPGLSVLFGPQEVGQYQVISAEHGRSIPKTLSLVSNYTIVDLPASLTAASRAALQNSDFLVLVVGRDPFCVESAKQILEAVHSWDAAPPLIGSVIVNRAALASPMELHDMEMQLGIPTLAVVPPAPDLCVAAEKTGTPLIVFDPESLAARSLADLADVIASRA